jgi:quaternary ammonium compound-resistance protein SugE
MSQITWAWIALLTAGCCEMAWPFGYKWSGGLQISRLWPWGIVAIVLLVVSFLLMGRAARVLPMGTVYAVWTGMGATGVAIAGMLFFHEPRTLARLICLSLVVVGVIGLKFFAGVDEASTTASHPPEHQLP